MIPFSYGPGVVASYLSAKPYQMCLESAGESKSETDSGILGKRYSMFSFEPYQIQDVPGCDVQVLSHAVTPFLPVIPFHASVLHSRRAASGHGI